MTYYDLTLILERRASIYICCIYFMDNDFIQSSEDDEVFYFHNDEFDVGADFFSSSSDYNEKNNEYTDVEISSDIAFSDEFFERAIDTFPKEYCKLLASYYKYDFDNYDYESYVHLLIPHIKKVFFTYHNSSLQGSEDLKNTAKSVTTLRNRARRDLVNRLIKNIDKYGISDKKNPAFITYMNFSTKSDIKELNSYFDKYGAESTLPELAMKVTKDKLDTWLDDKDQFFFSFPCPSFIKAKKLLTCYEYDIIHFLMKFISNNLNYNIYAKPTYPESLADYNIFSIRRRKDSVDEIKKAIVNNPNMLAEYIPIDNKTEFVTTLGNADAKILDKLTSYLGVRIFKTRIIKIPFSEAIEQFYSDRTSNMTTTEKLDDFYESLRHIGRTNINLYKTIDDTNNPDFNIKEQVGFINFIDSVYIDKDEEAFIIKLTPTYRDLLVNTKVIKTTTMDHDKILNTTSVSFSYFIQKLRIQTLASGKTDFSITCNHFKRIINIPFNHVYSSRDILIFEQLVSLIEEMKSLELFIDNYTICAEQFEVNVTFKPLTEYEKFYLTEEMISINTLGISQNSE